MALLANEIVMGIENTLKLQIQSFTAKLGLSLFCMDLTKDNN
jgi:hypothetical protein